MPPDHAEATGATAPEHEAFIVDEATDEVLRLHLDTFEGPLEVLLYLIKAQEIDIFDIPIATITGQYLRFLELMREENLEIAGDYLVLAATLIQIKSRMLLPAEADLEDDDELLDEEDPRLELVEKLIEYRRYRDITKLLEELEEKRADRLARNVKPDIEIGEDDDECLEVSMYDLIDAFRGVLRFMDAGLFHPVQAEAWSVDQKIEHIERQLEQHGSITWAELFQVCTSRLELVCCFLAILELCRMRRVRAQQHRLFGDIRLFQAPESAPA